MLVYIIDGFNVVYKLNELKTAPNPRSALINYIRNHKLTGSSNNKVVLVFDGGIDEEAKGLALNFKLIFSLDRSADDLIKKEIIKIKNKSEIVVVSDDRQIRDFAKANRTRILRVGDFISKNKGKNKKNTKSEGNQKNISYAKQHQITEELRKIWLGEDEK